MPDSEVFKIILQGGSFALIAVGVVWVLFRGGPMLREMAEKMAAEHRATVVALSADCRAERVEMRVWLSEEMRKRDAAIERVAAAVDRQADRMSSHDLDDPDRRHGDDPGYRGPRRRADDS